MLAAAGCSSGNSGQGEGGGSASDSPSATASAGDNTYRGTLAPPESAGDAYTYDPALAPVGAQLVATVTEAASSTTVKLEATGLLPDRGYAVHAHVNPCGATGDAAGPHFQNRIDPAATPQQPSSDPTYANPQNEIWLDLRTNGQGAGSSIAEVPFTFTDRAPASIVVHEAMSTATAAGEAGSAGDRLACLNLPIQ
ncbi:MAG: superoxide dismutase [Pseudonocardiaceae bacterium]|nr:superoxide dismutase [Pseudonocardiaceae bacterium]